MGTVAKETIMFKLGFKIVRARCNAHIASLLLNTVKLKIEHCSRSPISMEAWRLKAKILSSSKAFLLTSFTTWFLIWYWCGLLFPSPGKDKKRTVQTRGQNSLSCKIQMSSSRSQSRARKATCHGLELRFPECSEAWAKQPLLPLPLVFWIRFSHKGKSCNVSWVY